MPHEVETMVSARGVPWHGLGEVVEKAMTAKEALILAGLDWDVELVPVFARVTDLDHSAEPTYEYLKVEDHWASVRDTDKSVLGIVGARYKPVQNRDLFSFLDDLVGSGDAHYETAGSLLKGRRVFMTAKIPKEVRIGGEVPVDLFLVVASSHDGSLALTAMVTPVCVVCMNTLNMAIRGARQRWSIRHTESAEGRIAQAREALSLTFAYTDEWQAQMDRLAAEEFTKAEFEGLVRDVFPSTREIRAPFTEEQYAMIGVLESSPNITDGLRYTKWGALMAVTEHLDWGRDFRSSRVKSPAEQRTEAIWFGPTVEKKSKTLARLTS